MGIKEKLENATPTTFFDDDIVKDYENSYQLGYNKALDDVLLKVKEHHYLLSNKINSTDYGMFTCGIEQTINELKK